MKELGENTKITIQKSSENSLITEDVMKEIQKKK